jgi:dolichol-phosphate mannosyltransferase
METPKQSVEKVSVILPTYNEKDNIGPLISAIIEHVRHKLEIIIVDDDSPDGTWRIVEEIAQENPAVHLIRRTDKRGLVSALNDGISASAGDCVAWMDCDLSMPPFYLNDLIGKIEAGYDAAVASRFVEGGGVEIITGSSDSVLAFLLSRGLNRFIRALLNFSFFDFTSGFIVIRRDALADTPLRGNYGEYFIELIHRIKKQGFQTVEIPYICRARQSGQSKTGTNIFQYFKKGIKYITLTLRLKMKK